MTPERASDARLLLGWSRNKRAIMSDVPVDVLTDFERSARQVSAEYVAAIRTTLEAAGVEFTNGDGPAVQPRVPDRDT